MDLEIVRFVKENENWMEVLQAEPYNLSVKLDGDFALLSYNMISSDFGLRIVREARGIIFHVPTKTPVCIPFTKFFNVQEGHAAKIDWSTAVVTEKVDGSIIKVWHYGNKWHVSTNGTINADNASLATPFGEIKTYLDLFLSAENFPNTWKQFTDDLDPRYTYMFELTSHLNRVVVPYNKTLIYFLGARNNITFNEVAPDLCELDIIQPKRFSLKTVDECLDVCKRLGFDEEGFVVVDANFNRVKIKSVSYVAAHQLKNNGVVTKSRIADIIRSQGADDFLSIYPEYEGLVIEVLGGLVKFEQALYADWRELSSYEYENRKEFAQVASKTKCPAAMFALYDKKYEDVHDWLWAQNNEKIMYYIGVK